MRSTGCGRKKVASVSVMTGRAGRSGSPSVADAVPRGEPLVDVSARRRAHGLGLPRRRPHGGADPGTHVPRGGAPLGRRDARAARPPGRASCGPATQALLERARGPVQALSRRLARPASVRWVSNQGSSLGLLHAGRPHHPALHRLQGMPSWVLDYVLVHELVHLLVPGHGADFWAEVECYPQTERARAISRESPRPPGWGCPTLTPTRTAPARRGDRPVGRGASTPRCRATGSSTRPVGEQRRTGGPHQPGKVPDRRGR